MEDGPGRDPENSGYGGALTLELAPLVLSALACALSGAALAVSVLSRPGRDLEPVRDAEALLARVAALEEASARFVIEDGREMTPAETAALARRVVETQKELCSFFGKMSPKEAMREARRLHNLPP